MNKIFPILRIIVSPAVLMIIMVFANFYALKKFLLFIRYGGEWATYNKEDRKSIQDIYSQLKELNDKHKL